MFLYEWCTSQAYYIHTHWHTVVQKQAIHTNSFCPTCTMYNVRGRGSSFISHLWPKCAREQTKFECVVHSTEAKRLSVANCISRGIFFCPGAPGSRWPETIYDKSNSASNKSSWFSAPRAGLFMNMESASSPPPRWFSVACGLFGHLAGWGGLLFRQVITATSFLKAKFEIKRRYFFSLLRDGSASRHLSGIQAWTIAGPAYASVLIAPCGEILRI